MFRDEEQARAFLVQLDALKDMTARMAVGQLMVTMSAGSSVLLLEPSRVMNSEVTRITALEEDAERQLRQYFAASDQASPEGRVELVRKTFVDALEVEVFMRPEQSSP